MQLRFIFFCLFFMFSSAIVWISSDAYGLNFWQELVTYIRQQQQFFHRELASAVKAVQDGGTTAIMGMIIISFLYGVFHAAGPGHGKAVISTYLASSGTRIKQGIILTFTAAFIQGLGAVLLVEIFVGIARWSKREVHGLVAILESLSFILISILGLVLALRAARLWWNRHSASKDSHLPSLHDRSHNTSSHCTSCGHSHAVDPDLLKKTHGWRERAAIAFSIGIRPCSGSVLILFFAEYIGLRWAGITSVFAISIGTAITVSIIALITVNLRHMALKLQIYTGSGTMENLSLGIAFLGGIFIAILGFSLFQLSTLPAHPLL